MDKSESVIGQFESLSEQLEALAPCPFSRSMFIGWLITHLRALQGTGLSATELKVRLEADYLDWVGSA
ncbi:MAG: hypothetical protein R6V43_10670 [Halopseudomonas sp.]